ncbi:hypothetical protein [Rhodoferax sp.]|uniref:hypothetical protein n=1 Tax=Rhodoferax sp. TaxID=50421 RepID=UPI0025E25314|nr:hypothetical protein [Rhodoferax sp.]MCM2341699.1 hypothetical protein [Rhodoferax sp.]
MNRCPPALQGFSLGLMTLLLTLVTLAPEPLAAQGLLRQFPAAANILINGQPERLSPGARIKNPNNIIVLSGSLVVQALLVNYLRDPQGQVHEVWLLSPAEAQQKRAGMEILTNFVFGSDADKPKTDDGKTPFNQLPGFQQC